MQIIANKSTISHNMSSTNIDLHKNRTMFESFFCFGISDMLFVLLLVAIFRIEALRLNFFRYARLNICSNVTQSREY